MYSTIIRNVEESFLSLLLAVLIGLVCLQIGLRVFFDSGFNWADPLLRHLVVWCGLLGAVRGVADNKHIAINILPSTLPLHSLISRFIHLFAAIICGTLSYASLCFIIDEASYTTATLIGIPSWCWNLIFPLAFSTMTLRYTYKVCFPDTLPNPEQQVLS